MPDFAQVTIVGHLGRDPEIKAVGVDSVTSFSVATTRKRRDGETTTWWNCSMWGKRGAMIRRYLGKGDPILVTGEPYLRAYTTRDGREGVALEIDVKDWAFVGVKGDQSGSRGQGEHGGTFTPSAPYRGAQAPSAPSPDDDEIPF